MQVVTINPLLEVTFCNSDLRIKTYKKYQFLSKNVKGIRLDIKSKLVVKALKLSIIGYYSDPFANTLALCLNGLFGRERKHLSNRHC